MSTGNAANLFATIPPTPQDELERLVATYPGRDRRGYVTAFYVSHPRGTSEGPFATQEEAEAAKERQNGGGFFPGHRIVVGHVFTSTGRIVGPNTPPAPQNQPPRTHADPTGEDAPMDTPTFHLTIPSAQSGDQIADALTRTARELANRYDGLTPPPAHGIIQDANGAHVGTWEVSA